MKSPDIVSLFQATEVELIYKSKRNPKELPTIVTSSCCYDILINNWDMNKIELLEQFCILLLDRKNHCLGFSTVSTGGVSGCIADPKIIFATALKARASGIIVSHNHPSGNLQPSNADIAITEKLVAGGKYLDVSVLDHLIITPHAYYSFADEGMMP